jgi:hypothetical protein
MRVNPSKNQALLNLKQSPSFLKEPALLKRGLPRTRAYQRIKRELARPQPLCLHDATLRTVMSDYAIVQRFRHGVPRGRRRDDTGEGVFGTSFHEGGL